MENVLRRTHINQFGRDFGILIFLPRLRFFPGGLVPTVSPPWKLFTAEELAIIGAVQSVKKPPESINHAFLYCDFSTLVWNQWPENPLGTQEVRWSFIDLAMFILSHHSQQDLEFFFGIAWAIWYNRNKVVHEDNCLSHQQVWQLAKSVVEDFNNVVD
ncbi:hypothetical protein SO802_033751 [Lithocarpus litseifolius]|uniref:Uncharacterized protein n=1 Tax=Lithocarpus litseifolius TaxID=425828 RepID=A0AAW2BDW9_9ROSI